MENGKRMAIIKEKSIRSVNHTEKGYLHQNMAKSTEARSEMVSVKDCVSNDSNNCLIMITLSTS